ncbi:low molecular weight protein-tyrosine-phosphatase [uncultured Adlercreutzia sp.]|uniref:low molecular weight protein-tyrosine-phosphatase n=1 Tax=uncultured Adlercreutzia sp. TaxID=875803 RepID=UPI0025A58C9B|nr:low molecular weight protein-tyrosine-phosphatase [uncultured Adlercreutzia sp.]
MFRILFVCHGNICRSTMAEFVLKDMVAARGLAGEFHIESAATSTEEIGNPVHPGTQRMLREHGIGGFQAKQARQLTRADYDGYDLIIGMDEANIRNMNRMLGGDPDGKIHKLLEFAGSVRDVADPWYTGDFETTYDDVLAGCKGLLAHLGR